MCVSQEQQRRDEESGKVERGRLAQLLTSKVYIGHNHNHQQGMFTITWFG